VQVKRLECAIFSAYQQPMSNTGLGKNGLGSLRCGFQHLCEENLPHKVMSAKYCVFGPLDLH